MSVLQHVMQRAENKLAGQPVELAFPAGPVRGATSKLESVWTGIPPVDLAITGAVGGKWAAKKIRRRREMSGFDSPATGDLTENGGLPAHRSTPSIRKSGRITVPVIVAFTDRHAVVLDTGPIRKTWPRNQLLRVDKESARASYQRTQIPVDTRFRLNGVEWMVHGKYAHAIRKLVEESSWNDVFRLYEEGP